MKKKIVMSILLIGGPLLFTGCSSAGCESHSNTYGVLYDDSGFQICTDKSYDEMIEHMKNGDRVDFKGCSKRLSFKYAHSGTLDRTIDFSTVISISKYE